MFLEFASCKLSNYAENANFQIRISQNAKNSFYAPLPVNPRQRDVLYGRPLQAYTSELLSTFIQSSKNFREEITIMLAYLQIGSQVKIIIPNLSLGLQRRPYSIPPEAMMHFHPCFRFPPLFPNKFSDSVEKFPNFTFSRFFLDFHPPKFLMTSFSHHPQITPIFATSIHFPLNRENYSFPAYFSKFSPCFRKISCFLHTLSVFRFPPSPQFDHDALMHRTMHVLDAPVSVDYLKSLCKRVD